MSLLLGTVALLAAFGGTELNEFKGPMHYCGWSFAIDLAAGETVTRKDPGLDFIIEHLESKSGDFTVYEGNAPQGSQNAQEIKANFPKTVKRVEANAFSSNPLSGENFGTSYIIETGASFPALVHVWGSAFDGTDKDIELLKRLDFRDDALRKCLSPTDAK